MNEEIVPRLGIDADVKWCPNHTLKLDIKYKLHIVYDAGYIVVCLVTDVTTDNICLTTGFMLPVHAIYSQEY